MKQLAPILAVVNLLFLVHGYDVSSSSAVGDPGMKRDGLRVAFEAWNFCNEVGLEAPHMGSPRAADCFDVSTKCSKTHRKKLSNCTSGYSLVHKVSDSDNKLGIGKRKSGIISEPALQNPDLYAVEKELYLGSLCQVSDKPNPWSFWMVMLKNGNYDTKSGLCPQNGKKIPPFNQQGKFPCFDTGCMNQPVLNHGKTELLGDGYTMRGWFNGTYELEADLGDGFDGISYYEVVWEKKVGGGGWVFKHKLKTSPKYPWLMLYLRADATRGFSGGYHYDTRGMLKTLPESPNFKVRLTLDIKQGGGPKSQFYLLDIGSCWKNNGEPCDGDVTTDVTRYSEMIINPKTSVWCNPETLQNCPPYHTFRNGTRVHRTENRRFPYGAYHIYCAPGNAEQLELPVGTCDAFSNPQAQEILQLLPHPVWGEFGYPTRMGDGWVGDPRTWELDVGALSSSLYFYQDPGTTPARRIWTSVDVGTEIFIDQGIAEWHLSDFDVLIT
ncbi:hypothetical protein EUTSA_v10001420mg [Eutrema salsugineum]|uniref:DUF7705 domain-containing protein n=1 Tax=Eutrema salsugineum TaxID=72664 RepID=V4KN63_EUTSA|nr:uncharacterized protein LOC18015543 [Eutrema salsugineum]ESQ39345.1 hypothetical protein EUTSA_v10001420mg [Eutrema salsugineum]